MARRNSFNLMERERDENYRRHRERLLHIKGYLDNSPPKGFTGNNLLMNIRRLKTERQRQKLIERDNTSLLKRMTSIMDHGGTVDNWNEYQIPTCQQAFTREKQLEKICKENLKIADRLQKVKPYYNVQQWENEYQKFQNGMLRKHDLSPRSATVKQVTEQSKDDFKACDSEMNQGKLPEIENVKTVEQQSRSGLQVTNLPQINDGASDTQNTDTFPPCGQTSSVETLPQMLSGKLDWCHRSSCVESNAIELLKNAYLNGYAKETTEKCVQIKFGKPRFDKQPQKAERAKHLNERELLSKLDVDVDVVRLNSLIKNPEKAEEVILQTLSRKSCKERMKIKEFYQNVYNKKLEADLLSALSPDWHVLVKTLLEPKPTFNASHIHGYLKEKNIVAFVEDLCAKSEPRTNSMQEEYRKMYFSSLEADIARHVKKPLQFLLTTLLKIKKGDPYKIDEAAAETDAKALFEYGEGCWASENGCLLKLLRERSLAHMKVVFGLYQQVSGGKNILKIIQEECSPQDAEVICSLVNKCCEQNPLTYLVKKLQQHLKPTDIFLVRTLVFKSDLNISSIQKEYKKQFLVTLTDDMKKNCTHPTLKILLELASGGTKEHNKARDSKERLKKIGKLSNRNASLMGYTSKYMADKIHVENKETERKISYKDSKVKSVLGVDLEEVAELRNKAELETQMTVDLEKLTAQYKEHYGNSLAEDVKIHCSGDLQKNLLLLLDNEAGEDNSLIKPQKSITDSTTNKTDNKLKSSLQKSENKTARKNLKGKKKEKQIPLSVAAISLLLAKEVYSPNIQNLKKPAKPSSNSPTKEMSKVKSNQVKVPLLEMQKTHEDKSKNVDKEAQVKSRTIIKSDRSFDNEQWDEFRETANFKPLKQKPAPCEKKEMGTQVKMLHLYKVDKNVDVNDLGGSSRSDVKKDDREKVDLNTKVVTQESSCVNEDVAEGTGVSKIYKSVDGTYPAADSEELVNKDDKSADELSTKGIKNAKSHEDQQMRKGIAQSTSTPNAKAEQDKISQGKFVKNAFTEPELKEMKDTETEIEIVEQIQKKSSSDINRGDNEEDKYENITAKTDSETKKNVKSSKNFENEDGNLEVATDEHHEVPDTKESNSKANEYETTLAMKFPSKDSLFSERLAENFGSINNNAGENANKVKKNNKNESCSKNTENLFRWEGQIENFDEKCVKRNDNSVENKNNVEERIKIAEIFRKPSDREENSENALQGKNKLCSKEENGTDRTINDIQNKNENFSEHLVENSDKDAEEAGEKFYESEHYGGKLFVIEGDESVVNTTAVSVKDINENSEQERNKNSNEDDSKNIVKESEHNIDDCFKIYSKDLEIVLALNDFAESNLNDKNVAEDFAKEKNENASIENMKDSPTSTVSAVDGNLKNPTEKSHEEDHENAEEDREVLNNEGGLYTVHLKDKENEENMLTDRDKDNFIVNGLEKLGNNNCDRTTGITIKDFVGKDERSVTNADNDDINEKDVTKEFQIENDENLEKIMEKQSSRQNTNAECISLDGNQVKGGPRDSATETNGSAKTGLKNVSSSHSCADNGNPLMNKCGDDVTKENPENQNDAADARRSPNEEDQDITTAGTVEEFGDAKQTEGSINDSLGLVEINTLADEQEIKNACENEDRKILKTSNYDPDIDCIKLYKAMDGFGTEEKVIIDILTKRTSQERQQLRQKYQKNYKRSLREDLKNELPGDFEDTINGLMMEPVEFCAHTLHAAMTGLGTDELMLISMLVLKSSQELVQVMQKYSEMYGNNLLDDIREETNGNFQEMLLCFLNNKVHEALPVDLEKAIKDSKKIYQMTEEDMHLINQIFLEQSMEQVRETINCYKKAHGDQLTEKIRAVSSGEGKNLLVSLVTFLDDPLRFFAEMLNSAISGKNKELVSVIVSQAETNLYAIKSKYEELYGRSLEDAISSEGKNDFRRGLVEILKYH